MKAIFFLVNSNVYISLAAVLLTIGTQVQLGMRPQLHPYLFLIFFATLFEYNLHRFITVITNKEALNTEKHHWVKQNLTAFYLLVTASIIGFIIAAFFAKRIVIITLAPIAVLTLFYSFPVFKNKQNLFRLREIPCLKIFLIAFVWSAATIFLPIIQSGQQHNHLEIFLIFIERFLFIFSITIPFDIRDLKADKEAQLITIPLLVGEKKALFIANVTLTAFLLLSLIHYGMSNCLSIMMAFILSALSTFIFLNHQKVKNLPYYHYGILDGTILLQGILVCLIYYTSLLN